MHCIRIDFLASKSIIWSVFVILEAYIQLSSPPSTKKNLSSSFFELLFLSVVFCPSMRILDVWKKSTIASKSAGVDGMMD